MKLYCYFFGISTVFCKRHIGGGGKVCIVCHNAVSKYTLSRLFNTKLKDGFNDYLNSLRVRNAIELMETGKSISECAYESGFENLRTFNRAFKKVMGICPSAWRKN
ncbi:MAG: AraC family transcriptional regulator [Clostridia bacterium]|nr:AraC family transcriptional regulator [Clostridia bacterium]